MLTTIVLNSGRTLPGLPALREWRMATEGSGGERKEKERHMAVLPRDNPYALFDTLLWTCPHVLCGSRAGSASETRGNSYQMLSLSATAMQGVNGWNFTTEGTPGFLLRKIWSSSREIPAGGQEAATAQCLRTSHPRDGARTSPSFPVPRITTLLLLDPPQHFPPSRTFSDPSYVTVPTPPCWLSHILRYKLNIVVTNQGVLYFGNWREHSKQAQPSPEKYQFALTEKSTLFFSK